MEIVQTSQDALPTVAAIPPIENSTSTGTPLATQNAPVQSIFRWRPCAAPSALSGTAPASSAVIDILVPLTRHAPSHLLDVASGAALRGAQRLSAPRVRA